MEIDIDSFDGIPELYATENEPDPLVYACYAHQRLGWRWFVTEYDGSRIFFGLVAGFEVEVGYFDRLELEAAGARLDPRWEPITLSEARRWLEDRPEKPA
jgi:hypothetical protein